MTFTKDEMETMFQVTSNEIARLTKRANDVTLGQVDYELIETRIQMLQGVMSKLFDLIAE
jgi:hypothetical protein